VERRIWLWRVHCLGLRLYEVRTKTRRQAKSTSAERQLHAALDNSNEATSQLSKFPKITPAPKQKSKSSQVSHINQFPQSTKSSVQNVPVEMSRRTDSYLSLCLEQASHSSLHYRHGAIIVRGGKIIGQGHNDYRPGFNGGLKTGKMATGASNSQAIMALKQKNKSKQKLKQSGQCNETGLLELSDMDSNELGGGCLANTPLSMHSEMMAIQSALSLSSNMASFGSARSSTLMQKSGSFKLPGRGKRELRLRNLKDYVEAVCADAVSTPAGKQRSGKAYVQGSQFEPFASQFAQAGGAGLQCGGGGEGEERGGEGVCAAVHSVQYYERPQGVSVWASSRASRSPSCPPPRSRFDTTTTTTTTTTTPKCF